MSFDEGDYHAHEMRMRSQTEPLMRARRQTDLQIRADRYSVTCRDLLASLVTLRGSERQIVATVRPRRLRSGYNVTTPDGRYRFGPHSHAHALGHAHVYATMGTVTRRGGNHGGHNNARDNHNNLTDPRNAPSSWFAPPRPVHPLTHSAPTCKILWHRPSTSSVTGPDSDATIDHDLLRFDSAASDIIPFMYPSSHRVPPTQAEHLTSRSTMYTEGEDHLTCGLPRGRTDTYIGAAGLSYGIINQQKQLVRRPKWNRRLHASYLTAALLRRKLTRIDDDGFDYGASVSPCGGLSLIHSYVAMTPFGLKDAADPIILFTNSLRAETNDLIFLTSLLQWWCAIGGCNKINKSKNHYNTDKYEEFKELNEGSTMATARKRHRNIEIDFEIWFTHFSQYADLMLYGIKEVVMRYILDALAQRDVILSRAKAEMEPDDGMSRV